MAERTECAVDSGRRLRDWDGFGVNYVEMSHTHGARYEDFTPLEGILTKDGANVYNAPPESATMFFAAQ